MWGIRWHVGEGMAGPRRPAQRPSKQEGLDASTYQDSCDRNDRLSPRAKKSVRGRRSGSWGRSAKVWRLTSSFEYFSEAVLTLNVNHIFPSAAHQFSICPLQACMGLWTL